jgi:multiple sugar transport system ATP-binding protein
MAEIVLDGVWKTYEKSVNAVRGVNLRVGDGEFVVLVGPSGCGKSTTLRMIAGLEDISRGTISIGGRVVNQVHPKDRDIAMVFQNYALYPHMTVAKNMSFALRLRKTPKAEIERRVRQAAEMLDLTGLLERRPRQLSGGQRQRVAVGRAIVREPKAFLFDEPLSNLDAKLRTTTRAELKGLHHRLKTTTVYVTHDQEEAMTLGDRIVVMEGGLVQQVGPPLEVYERPVNRFVARFIGTPPMNILPGRISRDSGQAVFVEDGPDGARLRLPAEVAGGAHAQEGRPVHLGLRPQFLSEGHGGPTGTLQVTPRVVEPLGDLMDIHGTTASGATIVARVRARQGLAAGSPVPMAVDTERLLVFAADEGGANLALPEPVAG